MTYNATVDQLKKMEAERKKLVANLQNAKTDFEREQARQILKAHDIQAGKLVGVK